MRQAHDGASRLELWGGVECTVNRVGNGYSDQLTVSGHANARFLFKQLGVELDQDVQVLESPDARMEATNHMATKVE